MDPIIIAMQALNKAQQAAEYFNLIESTSSDVSKLLHQSFESAFTNLGYVATATNDNVEHYIRRALDEFIRACAVEKDINLINAYLGLSVCQFMLGDYLNARKTFAKIADIEPSRPLCVKANAKVALNFFKIFLVPSFIVQNRLSIDDFKAQDLLQFHEFKEKVLGIPKMLQEKYGS